MEALTAIETDPATALAEHSDRVIGRAAAVFHAESDLDLMSGYQAHPTHVALAAAALALQMEGQGLHPCYDSFCWGVDSSCPEEMEALQDAVTGREWQEIDDLARGILAAQRLARLIALAITAAEYPLAEMIADELPDSWGRIGSGEIEELARLAGRTSLRVREVA